MAYTYKHAIIVGLDGMGAFDRFTATPEMDRIFGEGASTHSALSLYPTISAQNWGAMLIGCDPDVHGLTNSIAGRELYTNKLLPSIFTTVRKAMPDSVLCSISNWSPINYGIIEHDVDVYMENTPDGEITTRRVCECIKEKKPTLLFLQNDDPDGAGHGFGYGTEGHLDCITKVDSMVGRIFNAYKEAGILDDTLFITITDHGGYDHGHGGYTDEEKYIFFALWGKTVKKTEGFFAQTKDINAIIRHAFGIEIPAYTEGGYTSQVPEGVFTDCDTEYVTAKPRRFDVANMPTPAIDGENGLYSYFAEDDVKFALFLDNDYKDATGNYVFRELNHVKYYSTGVRGAMGEFGTTGCLVCDEVKFGTGDFSIASWLKVDDAPNWECFTVSTKTMTDSGPGFSLGFTYGGSLFGIETDDPSTYLDVTTPYFREVSGGWIHVLYVFDKKDMQVKVYHNFKIKQTIPLPGIYADTADALPLTVGDDASHLNNVRNGSLFNADDIIAFNKALTDDDVKKLAQYYGL